MAYSLVQANEMYNDSLHSPKVHMVHFAYRFAPVWQLMHKVIKSGVLGQLYTIWGTLSQGGWYDANLQPDNERVDARAWRFAAGGGIVHELGSHLLDLCSWCFGDVKEVKAISQTFSEAKDASEDISGISLLFENACVAQLLLSRNATGYKERNFFEVYGSKGSLRIDQGEVWLWTREDPRWRSILVPQLPSEQFLLSFYQAVRNPNRKSEIPTFADGLQNNILIDAVLRSNERNLEPLSVR